MRKYRTFCALVLLLVFMITGSNSLKIVEAQSEENELDLFGKFDDDITFSDDIVTLSPDLQQVDTPLFAPETENQEQSVELEQEEQNKDATLVLVHLLGVEGESLADLQLMASSLGDVLEQLKAYLPSEVPTSLDDGRQLTGWSLTPDLVLPTDEEMSLVELTDELNLYAIYSQISLLQLQSAEPQKNSGAVTTITFVLKDGTEKTVSFPDSYTELGLNGAPASNGVWFLKSYFIGWSDDKDYIKNAAGHLFYDTNTVDDFLTAGLESGSKLYALYATTGLQSSFTGNTSIRINDYVAANVFLDQGDPQKAGDITTAKYSASYGDYGILKLEAVFNINPFVAAAIYKDPWVGALENGSDWSALSKKRGTVTVVDLNVQIDERVILPEEFELEFTSYVFRPYKVFSAVKADGAYVADGEVFPNLGIDQPGDKPGYGVLNRIKDDEPTTKFGVKSYLLDDQGKKVPVHNFVIRTRIRTGYDAYGKKVPASMEQIQSNMSLTFNSTNAPFKVTNATAKAISDKQQDPISISGHIDGTVKGVYFGPIKSETEMLDFSPSPDEPIVEPDEPIVVPQPPTPSQVEEKQPEKEAVKLIFDPDGGRWPSGSTEPMVIYASLGDLVRIPLGTSKEGAKFSYWEGSRYNPGDMYEVVGDHYFIARYEDYVSALAGAISQSAETAGPQDNIQKVIDLPRTGERSTRHLVLVSLAGLGILTALRKKLVK